MQSVSVKLFLVVRTDAPWCTVKVVLNKPVDAHLDLRLK